MSVTVRRASTSDDWAEATALLHDYVEWLRTAAGFEPLAAQPALAAELADPRCHYRQTDAVLHLARWAGVVTGSVAVRFHPDGSAELKRMYVRPIARGRGVADALVEAAVTAACERGCASMWLETKRGAMDRAIAVYARNGFREAASACPTLALDGIVVMRRAVAAEGRCA